MDNFPDLLYTHNKTRINDRWKFLYPEILNQFPSDSRVKNFSDNFTHMSGDDHQLHQQAFLHVVTETAFNYPVPFVTEKTFKPIANKRPFVIVGAKGTLSYIKSLGFKTFSEFWDEGYDNVSDPEQRLLAVVDIVETICNYSVIELQNLCNSMSDLLNYNSEYYTSQLRIKELEKLEQSCINNLCKR